LINVQRNNSRNTSNQNNNENNQNNNENNENNNENENNQNDFNENNLRHYEQNLLNMFNLGTTYPTNIFDTIPTNIFDSLPINVDLTQQSNLNENVIIALTDEEFEEINKIEFKDIETDSKCNICLDTYESSTNILKLKCGHTFDYNCIKNWLKNHSKKCLVCREEVTKGHPINL